MTSLVVLPRQLVVDSAGDVRSGAKLYTYASGTTTPLTSYTTSALSAANANPVVSLSTGLFPAIYFPGTVTSYKLVLKDSSDVTLWTEDNIPVPAADVINVQDFGAVGDGSTNDAVAIQAAIDTEKNVLFPAGTYFLGTANSGAFLEPAVSGQVFTFEGGATLKANGNTGVLNTAAIFYIDGFSHITLINPRFESNWGVDADRDVPYAVGLGTVNGYTRNVTLINPVAYKCQALVQAAKENHSVAYEVENVDVVNGYSDTCYYGCGFARTGSNVRAFYKALNAHRAYYAYGVHSHDVTVFDEHDGTVTAPTSYLHQSSIGATSFTGSLAAKDTHNIRLRYTVKGAQYTGIPFTLAVDHVSTDTKKGVMRDVHITFNDRGTGLSKSIGFLYFVDDVTTASYTGTAWDRITLDGYAKNPFDLTNAGVLGGPVVQTVLGTMDIGGLEMNATPTSANNPHGDVILFEGGRQFDDAIVGNFTPTIIGTGTPGAGTYTTRVARWHKRGRTVHVHGHVDISAHTGAGNITIGTLPYAGLNLANDRQFVNLTSESLTYTGDLVGIIEPNESVIRVMVAATTAALAAVTLDTACKIYFNGTYETN